MPGLTIGTHNGKFHADEVLGCFMLKQLPKYKDATIVRSRDPKTLDECSVVIDVGGVYNHDKCRYDHHQRGFLETMGSLLGMDETVKLSSAGLVYAHYGKEVIKAVTPKPLTEEEIDMIYNSMYHNLIREVDAIDNGIDPCNHKLRYTSHTDLSSRIRRLNPNPFFKNLPEEGQFKIAMDVAKQEFMSILNDLVCCWLPARKYVEEAIENREKVDESKRIIEFSVSGIPWVKHLIQLEDEKHVEPEILFAVFPDSSNGWRVQAVPLTEGFELRSKVLPKCCALRDEVLAAKCNVPDAFFVHANGFIGGAKSREGAIRMAQLSLPQPPQP